MDRPDTFMLAQPPDPRVTDRRLYLAFACVVPLLVLIGFARTYYLKGVFHGPALPSPLVHVHGLLMTSWVVLFGVQVGLISAKRVRWHMTLGMFGTFLAAAIVVVGVVTSLAGARRDLPTAGAEALRFLVIPLGDMVAFPLFVGLGIVWRRRLAIHKRLMLLATAVLIPAAVARIPLGFIANGGAPLSYIIADLFILAAVLYDTIRNRRLHPVFLWGTVATIAIQVIRLNLAHTDLWLRFTGWLVNLG